MLGQTAKLFPNIAANRVAECVTKLIANDITEWFTFRVANVVADSKPNIFTCLSNSDCRTKCNTVSVTDDCRTDDIDTQRVTDHVAHDRLQI